MVTIEISEELKKYLDEVAYGNGAEAWYTEQIKLPLDDYDYTIKSILNDFADMRAFAYDDMLMGKRPFELKVIE